MRPRKYRMVKIKVCGITSLIDAQRAVAAGVDALGFNFYPFSPRYISPSAARAIIQELPSSIVSVGVFVNLADPQEVIDRALSARVARIQLHGDETPEYCRQLAGHHLIKALRVGRDFQTSALRTFATDAILLDAFSHKSFGGSGERFDWAIAKEAQRHVDRLYLAGGLTADNVSEAIAFVRPYAVDVCSGVEARPGVKDDALLRRFVAQVRRTLAP